MKRLILTTLLFSVITISYSQNIDTISSGTNGDAILRIESDTDNSNEGDNSRIEMFQDGGSVGAYLGFDYNWGGPNQPDNLFRIGTRYNNIDNFNRLVINTQNGNVGIGTSDPVSRLEIDYSGTMGGLFDVQKSYFRLKNGSHSLLMDNNEIYSSEALILGSSYSNDIEFRNVSSATNEKLMTIKPTGRVGIGTNTPNEKLQVNGNIRLNDYSIKSGGDSRIDFGNTGVGNENDDLGIYVHNDGEFEMFRNDKRMMNVSTHFNLALDSEIKVGIGTTTPTHKLAVNGTVRSKEVIVDNDNWPDYVFTDSYQLKSLQEVSEYIAKNGHLPNIPSADEVEANGFELAKMNASLLEKIEELTLYTIDQEAKLKNQEALIQSLIQRIEKLEK